MNKMPKNKHRCHRCRRTFKDLDALTKHIQGHKPMPTCLLCSKTFAREAELRVHMRAHENGEQHACPFCTFVCLSRGALTRHERAEHQASTCEECKITFSSLSVLKAHNKAKHPKPIPNPVLCMWCFKPFRTKAQRDSHVFWKHDEKTVQCPICSNDYKNKYNLNKHMKTKHQVFKTH